MEYTHNSGWIMNSIGLAVGWCVKKSIVSEVRLRAIHACNSQRSHGEHRYSGGAKYVTHSRHSYCLEETRQQDIYHLYSTARYIQLHRVSYSVHSPKLLKHTCVWAHDAPSTSTSFPLPTSAASASAPSCSPALAFFLCPPVRSLMYSKT